MAIKPISEDKNFDKIFIFICATTAIIMLYIIAITFLPIPKENLRFADTCQGILLGVIITNAAYLTGGSPPVMKKSMGGETTAEINATITTVEDANKG